MAIITGRNAKLFIGTKDATLYALSDFSLSFDRGTVEQELVGREGNYFTQGAMSIDGSLTNCRFAASGNSDFLDSIVAGTVLKISGSINEGQTDTLIFSFSQSQVTGYDVAIGDASTITEASIDFTVMNPKDVTYLAKKVSG